MNEIKAEDMSIKDEFELRDKRLKLVYKILYVLAALWLSLFINLTSISLDSKISPVYCFFLAVLSLYIVNIVKYSMQELSCMRINKKPSEQEKENADMFYTDIWRNSAIIAVVASMAMFISMYIPQHIMPLSMVFGFFIGTLYFAVVLTLEDPPKILQRVGIRKPKEDVLKMFHAIGILASVVVAYSLFGILCCALMMK